MIHATLQLHGTVRLLDTDGVDLTPRSKYAKAVLGILARNGNAGVQRRELENLLWTSDPQSRQMSLRSCLTAIRKSLALSATAAPTLLHADHNRVWIDTEVCQIIEADPVLQPGLLLEDITLTPQAFTDWLETERAVDETRETPVPVEQDPDIERRTLWVQTDDDIELGPSVDAFHRQLWLNLKDSTPVQSIEYSDASDDAKNPTDLLVQILPYRTQARDSYALTLKRIGGRELIWRNSFRPHYAAQAGERSVDDVHVVAHETSDHILRALWSKERSSNCHVQADHMVGEALRLLGTFAPSHMLESKRLLQRAQSIRPHPSQLAWLSVVITFIALESAHLASDTLIEEARTHANNAVSDAPDNALVLALVSHQKLLLDRDYDAAYAMASEAATLNPGLAMAHLSLGLCHLHQGKDGLGLAAAERGLELGRHTPIRNWWTMALVMIHTASADYPAAIAAAHLALLGAQEYRAPLRYLYPLYLVTGQRESAVKVRDKMRLLEPRFSIRYMRSTPDYPIEILRRTTLLEQTDITD